MAEQLSLDAFAAEQTAATHLADLHDIGEQHGVVERATYAEAWVAAHTHFDMYRRMTENTPWVPYTPAITAPGAFLSAADLAEHRALGVCSPTLLSADCRPDRPHLPNPRPGRPPYTSLYRGACLGCTWEGPPRTDENTAVEDAHDHVYPPWWRTLPTVTKPTSEGASREKAVERIAEVYEDHTPGCTSHPAGCPVWTRRHVAGRRHHSAGLLGGYDLARLIWTDLPEATA